MDSSLVIPATARNWSSDGAESPFYLVPAGIVAGQTAATAMERGRGRPLAGGPLVFTACEILTRHESGVTADLLPLDGVLAWAAARGEARVAEVGAMLDRLSAPRPPFAGLSVDRPRVMAVVNVTPDSFSDGGDFTNPYLAMFHALRLREAGADIIDVGGESTRPGADPVAPEEEIARVVPVVKALAERGVTVSIDTRHARVMAAALDGGAAIVNDVTALTGDPDALALVARRRVPVILMHMQGEPRTMQADPHYACAPADVFDALAARVAVCRAAGIDLADISLDPGIGFGKTVAHNLEVLARLSILALAGCPVTVGVSRKSFIARLSRGESPKERLSGSLAAVQVALDQGASIVRVHDVAETVQAVAVWRAVRAW